MSDDEFQGVMDSFSNISEDLGFYFDLIFYLTGIVGVILAVTSLIMALQESQKPAHSRRKSPISILLVGGFIAGVMISFGQYTNRLKSQFFGSLEFTTASEFGDKAQIDGPEAALFLAFGVLVLIGYGAAFRGLYLLWAGGVGVETEKPIKRGITHQIGAIMIFISVEVGYAYLEKREAAGTEPGSFTTELDIAN